MTIYSTLWLVASGAPNSAPLISPASRLTKLPNWFTLDQAPESIMQAVIDLTFLES